MIREKNRRDRVGGGVGVHYEGPPRDEGNDVQQEFVPITGLRSDPERDVNKKGTSGSTEHPKWFLLG